MLMLRQPSHVRFEPRIDGGTAFAFNFREGKLVVGREAMWRLIQTVDATHCSMSELAETLVDSLQAGHYPDAFSLYVDITRLVDAGVLEGTPDPDSTGQ